MVAVLGSREAEGAAAYLGQGSKVENAEARGEEKGGFYDVLFSRRSKE